MSEISLCCTFSGVWFYFSLNTIVFFTFHRAFSRKIVFHSWSKLSIYPCLGIIFNVFHNKIQSIINATTTHALVSFKKYMPPPLPYFKVNICPLPLPHFASIFFAYLWSFRWPNYIVTLPRYFSFRLPHLNINTGPPQTNWTRIFSESRIFYFSVTETDTVTSGPF